MKLEEYHGLSVEISPEDEVFLIPDKFNWCSIFRGIGIAEKGCYHYINESENSKWDIY
ncbi:MAG TPA: hypothetical protein PK669_00545 [Methanosarcina thermophila]|uniref:hypothetical protein n=1 Tax=Methanosarcina thermophila TaxID=2210 RepID=UPI000B1F2AFA|nr:hypothetical protein [Methanosarcina thermophila]HOA68833.1 hypothetical protein [Methanosarcina thermophila]HOQ64857.1 hypothetical protein [Methanosarcina thermophila]HPT80926.1 hypothetical protein [Methanosarcina thermophila]HPZ18791.1 hypothetical protein [Methanosarcina thermophila]HQD93183.1 hypothetical protein [Methanosarcina thermophila]